MPQRNGRANEGLGSELHRARQRKAGSAVTDSKTFVEVRRVMQKQDGKTLIFRPLQVQGNLAPRMEFLA
jgi:hypothetical protein